MMNQNQFKEISPFPPYWFGQKVTISTDGMPMVMIITGIDDPDNNGKFGYTLQTNPGEEGNFHIWMEQGTLQSHITLQEPKD